MIEFLVAPSFQEANRSAAAPALDDSGISIPPQSPSSGAAKMIGAIFNRARRHRIHTLDSTFCRQGHQLLTRRAEISELIDRGGGRRKGEVCERLGQYRIEKSRHADADSDVRAEILAGMFREGGDVVDHRWMDVRFGRGGVERCRCSGLHRPGTYRVDQLLLQAKEVWRRLDYDAGQTDWAERNVVIFERGQFPAGVIFLREDLAGCGVNLG